MKLAVMILALSACSADNELNTEGVQDTQAPPMKFEIVPPILDFGSAPLNRATSRTVAVHNLGTDDLLIESFEVPEGVVARLPGMPVIQPTGTALVEFTWTPQNQWLDQDAVIVLSNGELTESVRLPLNGTGLGGVLTFSTTAHDFGNMNIGCQEDFTVTFTNTGNEPVVLDNIRAAGDPDFRLSEFELPLTLGPFDSRQLDVVFRPMTPGHMASYVEFEGKDVQAHLTLDGTGIADGDNEQTWTVGSGSDGKMIVVFHVHGWFIPGGYSEGYGHGGWAGYFEENLEHYFEVLQDNGADYRMVFLWNPDGEVRGSVPYLDNSYTPEQSKDIVFEKMLSGGVNTDYDLSWPLYMAAMEENDSWMEESATWLESKLSFVLIHRDQEQSGIPWTTALSTLQSYRDDEDLVTINGITGPPPAGCDGVVEYPRNYYEAVDASDGIILSACETDWTEHWETLAAQTMNGSVFFSLQGTVVPSSIQVRVDGQEVGHWSYDAGFNAVKFDDGNYPSPGSTVNIRYLLGGEC